MTVQIFKKNYEQLYGYKLDNWAEMAKYLERQKHPKVIETEIANVNRTISSK